MAIQAIIQPEPTCLGFQLVVRNTGTQPVEVVILNPYTGVELFSLDHRPIGKDSFFTWEQSDPHITLGPGHSVLASIKLYSIWTGINSEVLVHTHVKWRILDTEEFQSCCAEGRITLSFPVLPQRTPEQRITPFSALVFASRPKLLNVSDYISILEYTDTDHPPWRGEPIGMWG
jgi:hypothetical protein